MEKLLIDDDLARSCEILVKQGGLFKSEKQAAFIISKINKSHDFAPTHLMMDYDYATGVIAGNTWNKDGTTFQYYYVVDEKGIEAKVLSFTTYTISKNNEKALEEKYNVNITDEGIFYKEGPRVNDRLKKEIWMQLRARVNEKFTTKWERNNKMSNIDVNDVRKKIAKNLQSVKKQETPNIMNFEKFPEYKNYVKFGDVARKEIGDQAQYAKNFLEGKGNTPAFGKGLKYHCFGVNGVSDYHDIIIDKDDAKEFVKKVLKFKLEQGIIGKDNQYYKNVFGSNIVVEDDLSTQQIKKVADNFIRFIMGDKEQALKNLKILKIDYNKKDEESYNKDYEKAYNDMIIFLKKHFK